MVNVALTITTKEEVGVLDEITKVISAFGFNISYANLYVGIDTGVLNIELENVENLDEFIEELYKIDFVLEIEKHSTLKDIFGKRIIIIGGGAQVSKVAAGAIIEESISVWIQFLWLERTILQMLLKLFPDCPVSAHWFLQVPSWEAGLQKL